MKFSTTAAQLFLAISVTCWLPAAFAENTLDGLDETMEVLDSEEDLSTLVSGMRNPSSGGVDVSLGDEDPGSKDDEPQNPYPDDKIVVGDGFDRDATFREDQLLQEEAWEDMEGEDRDLDIVEDDDPMGSGF